MSGVKRYGPNLVGEMIELEHGLYVASRDYDKDTASLRADRDTNREMAGYMDLLRKDMISAGVVTEQCAPMFMTEGVLGYIGKLQAERDAALKQVVGLRVAGNPLSNVAFNLAQKVGYTLTEYDCQLLSDLRKRWDAALATPSPQ